MTKPEAREPLTQEQARLIREVRLSGFGVVYLGEARPPALRVRPPRRRPLAARLSAA